MAAKLDYNVPVAPLEFIERLRADTVPFEGIASLRSPISSYTTFLKESFAGPRQVLAKIDGNTFRLMTIGFWPFKGASIFANVGAMHGKVEESPGGGSEIHAEFRIALMFLVQSIALCGLLVLVLAGATGLLLFGAGLEGRFFMLGGCAFFAVIAVTMIAYVFVGARVQETAIRRFLDELAANVRSAATE
jgi:hypothetical protein